MISAAIIATCRDAREGDQLLAELDALAGIAQAEIEGGLGNADARARGLMRAASKVCMSCLKPWPSTPPRRFSLFTVSRRRRFRIPSCRDSRAPRSRHRHPFHRDGFSSVPRGFSAISMESPCSRFSTIGPHQQCHDVGADGMGDPGLVAETFQTAASPSPSFTARVRRLARSGRCWLGKDGGGQDLARGQLRQPFLLLLGRAAAEDEFGRDLRAGAERARRRYRRATVPPRRRTWRPWSAHAAEFLGDGQPKTPSRPSSRRPRSGCSRSSGATHGRGGVTSAAQKRRISERIASSVSSRPGSPTPAAPSSWLNRSTRRARFSGCCPARSGPGGRRIGGGDRFSRGRAQRGARSRPGSSGCRRKSARHIRRHRCGSSNPRSRHTVLGCEAFAIGLELAQRHHIGREPGEAVSGVLLRLEPGGGDLALHRHSRAHGRNGILQQVSKPGSAAAISAVALAGPDRRSGRRLVRSWFLSLCVAA